MRPIELDVDLSTATAQLRSGDETVDFKLQRVTDPQRWRPDCGTMGGHALEEVARLDPAEFKLGGQTRHYDKLSADCTPGSVALRGPNPDDVWYFDVAAPPATATPAE